MKPTERELRLKLNSEIEKIESRTFKEAEKLIYDWLNTGHISLDDFRFLCRVNRECVD